MHNDFSVTAMAWARECYFYNACTRAFKHICTRIYACSLTHSLTHTRRQPPPLPSLPLAASPSENQEVPRRPAQARGTKQQSCSETPRPERRRGWGKGRQAGREGRRRRGGWGRTNASLAPAADPSEKVIWEGRERNGNKRMMRMGLVHKKAKWKWIITVHVCNLSIRSNGKIATRISHWFTN